MWLSRLTRTRPVEARRHLFDMCRFAGAVIALQYPAIARETGQDRRGGVVVDK